MAPPKPIEITHLRAPSFTINGTRRWQKWSFLPYPSASASRPEGLVVHQLRLNLATPASWRSNPPPCLLLRDGGALRLSVRDALTCYAPFTSGENLAGTSRTRSSSGATAWRDPLPYSNSTVTSGNGDAVVIANSRLHNTRIHGPS